MTIRTLTSLDNCVRGLRRINEKSFMETYKKTIEFYVDKLIIRHFLPGYGRSAGWTPNSPEYQAWKRKRFGDLPQLVLRGKLKSDARKGRPNKQGKKYVVRWYGKSAQTYGKIQSKRGRNWAIPSSRDSRDMIRKFKSEFKKLRMKQKGIKIK